jgi:serine phosphatase RsbU (regulator of sigma subunit)/pSer/pThr/pTyr-binding forkhead associated (FHA) protein
MARPAGRFVSEGPPMPSLHVLKGANEGALIPLDGDKFVLGRNPDCGIVIPVTSVSREHAQILRVQGRYYIEDKQSRNGTFVNNQAITSRTPLKNNDKIRICDFLAAFLDNEADEDEEAETSSTVEAMLTHSSHQLLDQQPAEKLRLLLEISGDLSKTLQLDALLPKIVDSLFQMFRQADRCFLVQTEEGTGKLMSRVIKTRRVQDEPNARFSRSIVRRCLDTAQAFLSDDASRDDRIQLSQSVVDFRIRSVMCVPVCNADGKAFGVIQLDTQDRSKKFTQDDLKLLWGVANQAAIALENARMHEEAVAQERLRRDLELASRIQRSFLPHSLPQVPGYEFAAHYEAAMEVGGDYYGFIPLPQGRLAVALGDVAGKGVSAALLMAKLSSDTRFSLLTEPDAGRAVGQLNDLLYQFTSEADRFVTLAVALLDPIKHTAALVNAGHLAPLVYRQATGQFHEAVPKEKAGVPLGILQGYGFEACSVALGPGDTLLMFTDGVTDSRNVQDRALEMTGVEAALRDVAPASAAAVVERLSKAVKQHASGRAPHDDVTLVALGRTL